jgi:flagellar export protein FliJ
VAGRFCIMKKFRFKLEAVRKIRMQEEQAMQAELAAALRERVEHQRRLDDSLAAEQELYAYLREGTFGGAELEHISRYSELHRKTIFDARIFLHHHDQMVERARRRVIEARAKREALDKLCEKQRERHRQAWLAEEARELDEIASQRFASDSMVSSAMRGAA